MNFTNMNKSDLPYSQISEFANVSPSTVSRALRQPHLVKHSTLKKIYAAINELGGTLPDSVSMLPKDSRILTIVPILNNPFYTDIVQGIQDAARQNGYQMVMITEMLSQFNIQEILHLITQSDISGVIIMQKVDIQILEQLKMRVPIVQCSEYNNDAGVSYVTIDNYDATQKLIRYLLSTGCRDIALINYDKKRFGFADLRFQGYLDSLSYYNLSPDPAHIVYVTDGKFSTTVSSVSAMLKISRKPDAIFCVSDIMAAAALRACVLEGFQIPRDILIAGFDNIDISVMTTPNITTINQPRYDMGFMACTQLISLISNPQKEAQQFILDTELIIRESTTY